MPAGHGPVRGGHHPAPRQAAAEPAGFSRAQVRPGAAGPGGPAMVGVAVPDHRAARWCCAAAQRTSATAPTRPDRRRHPRIPCGATIHGAPKPHTRRPVEFSAHVLEFLRRLSRSPRPQLERLRGGHPASLGFVLLRSRSPAAAELAVQRRRPRSPRPRRPASSAGPSPCAAAIPSSSPTRCRSLRRAAGGGGVQPRDRLLPRPELRPIAPAGGRSAGDRPTSTAARRRRYSSTATGQVGDPAVARAAPPRRR